MGWLVLAAGQSNRFGGDKLLTCPYGSDKTMIEYTLARYAALPFPILVVTRPEHHVLHSLLTALKIDFTVCHQSHQGMSASLAWGVQQIQQDWSWVGIVLADMPFVTEDSLHRLVEQIKYHEIVIPRFESHDAVRPSLPLYLPVSAEFSWGHPVLISQSYFKQLLLCDGDCGARSWLRKNTALVHECVTKDLGVLLDIDTREKLTKLETLFAMSNGR